MRNTKIEDTGKPAWVVIIEGSQSGLFLESRIMPAIPAMEMVVEES